MKLKNLVQQRQFLNRDILECLEQKITEIKVSGENMVECATNIRGHGYSTFMASREHFLGQLEDLVQEIRLCESINTSTHH